MNATVVLFLSLSVLYIHCQDVQDNEALKNHSEAEKADNRKLSEIVKKMQLEMLKLQGRIMELEDKNTALEAKMHEVSAVTQPVACSVALGTTVTLSAGDIIKFDHIFLDTHNYYNPDLGIFTIRTTGIYEINAAVYKATGDAYNDVQADLWLNYAQVTRLYSYTPAHEATRAHSSQSIILHLAAGDQLYIRTATSVSYSSFTNVDKGTQFSVKYLGQLPEHM